MVKIKYLAATGILSAGFGGLISGKTGNGRRKRLRTFKGLAAQNRSSSKRTMKRKELSPGIDLYF